MPDTNDLGIITIAVVIVAVLLYRLVRREPLNRIVRLGLFIERRRFDEDEPKPIPPPSPPPPLPPSHDEEATEAWPSRDPGP